MGSACGTGSLLRLLPHLQTPASDRSFYRTLKDEIQHSENIRAGVVPALLLRLDESVMEVPCGRYNSGLTLMAANLSLAMVEVRLVRKD